jgi:hypothetical protein
LWKREFAALVDFTQARNGPASRGSERKSCRPSIVVEHFHRVQRVVAKIPADE